MSTDGVLAQYLWVLLSAQGTQVIDLQGVPKYCVHFVLGNLWAREASIVFLNGRIIQQIKFWVEKCIKRPLSLLSKLRNSYFKIKGAILKVTKFKSERARFCWGVQYLLLTAVMWIPIWKSLSLQRIFQYC